MEFIDWETLEFKKQSGKEKMRCPSCDGSRSSKTDKSLQINHGEGFGKCHYCESLTFKKEVEETIEYKLPQQNWRNYTKLSDNMVKWLEDTRNIKQSTAIELGWTEEKYYQPAEQKEMTNIVYNFFEGKTLVNKKYRSANKRFTQSAGTKSIFYNINSIIGKDEAYIVEGEFDVAAMHQIGIKNVISVPNGANDNDNYWKSSENYLKDIKRFIIAVDKDDKGNELKNKIAQRLGRYRCSYIDFDGKDANDDLISGILETTVKNVKRFPVSGTFKVDDLCESILDLYDNGLPETMSPKDDCFKGMKDIFSVMRGQLTVGTGIPSHGKSNFTDWYVLNLIKDYNLKASWFSPEHSPMSLYHTNLSEKVIGKSFWGKADGREVERITKQDLAEYFDWANEKIYLTDADGGQLPTWDWLLETFKEQMYSYGVDVFVIDAFNKVLLPKGNKIDEINVVLTKLTHFAQANNVLIFLVAHPTKMQKDENGVYACPTLYDVSGSADFRNQTHNGFSIYRHFQDIEQGTEDETEFINMKTKFNFQGNIGQSVKFKYCRLNGRYSSNDILPLHNFLKPLEVTKTHVATLQEAFEEPEDEIPF